MLTSNVLQTHVQNILGKTKSACRWRFNRFMMNLFCHFFDAEVCIYKLKKKRYFVAACTSGLGNRIKCLVSTLRLAEKYGGTPLVCWPVNEECGCRFPDLFVNPIRELSLDGWQEIENSKENEDYFVLQSWKFEPLVEDRIPKGFSVICGSSTGRNIDLEYTRIPTRAKENILPYVKNLTPTSYIRNEVQHFTSGLQSDCIALAMRSWRTSSDSRAARAKEHFSIQPYIEALRRLNAKQVLVCSDCQQVAIEASELLGSMAIQYKKQKPPEVRNCPEAIQDALIEMLLVANCSGMVLSRWSTFSEMAWWMGGCPDKIELL